ncbi:hypothetical protein HZC34_04610 [Candidatus Saganbacteria bacterium]|nr:hypothetical protein [Candidatus Saganbacteria bacterium]
MSFEVNKIDSARTEQAQLKRPKKDEELQCIFYKGKTCSPQKAQFKICLKCHRCVAITVETAIPAVFNRIVALASLLMATFGAVASAQAGQGAGAGTGGGAGSGGGGSPN